MNYFRCRCCGKLNDLDSFYCDIYHKWAYEAYKADMLWWMQRNTPLLDYYHPAEWEYDFSPLGGSDG